MLTHKKFIYVTLEKDSKWKCTASKLPTVQSLSWRSKFFRGIIEGESPQFRRPNFVLRTEQGNRETLPANTDLISSSRSTLCTTFCFPSPNTQLAFQLLVKTPITPTLASVGNFLPNSCTDFKWTLKWSIILGDLGILKKASNSVVLPDDLIWNYTIFMYLD